jgi:hypothetical protein
MIMANLQHQLDYYPPFIDEAVGAFVGVQDRFPKEFPKMMAPPPFVRQAPVAYSPGPKACAQCGTTRTPQWREGPEGPKTLCNACGVKRVRQMRTTLDGNKRRMAGKSPSSFHKQVSSDLPVADSLYEAGEIISHKRPLRKAAARAATRTAEFANTGEWVEEEAEEEYSYHSSQDTGSGDSADHNSDSAEEVAWVPERHAHPRHLPPSPMANAVGIECAAAVNLLSMSVHDAVQQASQQQHLRPATQPPIQRTASGGAAADFTRISASGYLHMASAASKWDCHLPVHAKAQESVQDALRALPPAKHTELLLLKDDLDNISREAAAADAAVAAVAKILAMKQAAAIRARTSASQAAKKIQRFMHNLDEEYGWSRQRGEKRQRAS